MSLIGSALNGGPPEAQSVDLERGVRAMISALRRRLHRWVQDRPNFRRGLVYFLINAVRSPRITARKWRERRFYRRLLGKRPHGVIFDIGANVGSKAEIFRHHGRVVCVEPSPSALTLLQRRFADCEEVEVIHAAVSDVPGTSVFFDYVDEPALSTLNAKWVATLQKEGGHDHPPTEIQVKLTTIGALIEGFGAPRYVKIDVEGSENSVIRGMRSSLPLLSAEFNLPEFFEELVECVRHLEELDPGARFNLVLSDPPSRFEYAEWQVGASLTSQLQESEIRYVELYCLGGK